MKHDNILTTIPILSPEWALTFNLRLIQKAPIDNWESIIHLTGGENHVPYGSRTPAVWVEPNSTFLSIFNSVNSYPEHIVLTETLPVNQTIRIEIHQRYVSNGEYRYFVLLNGKEINSIMNSDARQFYEVKVYSGDLWYPPCTGFISNVELTNFL